MIYKSHNHIEILTGCTSMKDFKASSMLHRFLPFLPEGRTQGNRAIAMLPFFSSTMKLEKTNTITNF